jgi:D-xylose 1-dehydrogenase (NADP+, D-xylono-1,5-lactone-forming)
MPLRWGILGVARINRALIPPIQASERHDLVAIASRDASRADEAAKQWGIPRAYGSYEDLLADRDIDVVYIPVPNGGHATWTIRAAEAGKHVLCEKPLALSVEDVDRIQDAARRAGVVVAEAFMYRHHPQTLRIRELVAAGTFGTLRLVTGSFTFSLTKEADPRLDKAQGGGSVWDVGCYPVSFTRFVLDAEPSEAFGWQATGPTGIDETFAGALRFPNGVLALFDSGFRAPLRTHVEIVGSEASLVVPHPFKPGLEETMILSRGDATEEVRVAGQELYSGEIEDMADAILLGRPSRVTLAESRGNVAALVALLESASKGRPVSLS